MFHQVSAIRRLVVAVAGLLMFTVVAHAGDLTPITQPANGLGQAWPNAPDVSASPIWHVYTFTRDQIHYIQVNDANGGVRIAFAVAGDTYVVLPVGSDNQRVSTPQQPLTLSASGSGQIVYRDAQVQVIAVPAANGTAWEVQQIAASQLGVPTKRNIITNQSLGTDPTGCRECGGDATISTSN